MVFYSIEFLAFFVAVILGYYFIADRFKWIILLSGSYIFCASQSIECLLILLLSTAFNYFVAIRIENANDWQAKQRYLSVSVITNLFILCAFKYLLGSINGIGLHLDCEITPALWSLVLPIGLSYYTFQNISYSLDIYTQDSKAERHFGAFALYLAFFPRMIVGPIERPNRLLTQFRQKIRFDYKNIEEGIVLIFWGLFKKVVVADRLAVAVALVYDNIDGFSALPIVVASYLFTYQLYCDFSGYSDIAVGLARVFGIRLTMNFKRPFMSRNPSEFWQRWHISLSEWIRDYLFVPIFRRTNNIYLTQVVVMAIMGFWHGATWNFVIWGCYWGIAACLHLALKDVLHKMEPERPFWHNLWNKVKVLTMFHIAVFSVVFFRTTTIQDAFYAIKTLIFNWDINIQQLNLIDDWDLSFIIILVSASAFLQFVQHIQGDATIDEFAAKMSFTVRAIFIVLIVLTVVALGVSNQRFFIYSVF